MWIFSDCKCGWEFSFLIVYFYCIGCNCVYVYGCGGGVDYSLVYG